MIQVLQLPLHRELLASSRVAGWSSPTHRLWFAELAVLVGAGATAAVAVACLDFSLRIPGHAILRAVFPMALGLSLAPRRLGGIVMGAGACTTLMLLKATGGRVPGLGALASLCALGPVLDVALWWCRSGWPVYLSFALAGWGANLIAFAVRGAGKMSGLDGLRMRPLSDWLTVAPWTYSLCGLVAGLVSAAIWFRLRVDRDTGPAEEPPS
jgi:hypothetical protein